MAELVKSWNDGGSLSISYDGDGDGFAVFSSDVNEGVDREVSVAFVDKSRSVRVDRKVVQEDRRERFRASDRGFILADGGTLNVIKNGLQ